MTTDGDEFLTRREADVLIASGRTAAEEAREAHQRQHEAEQLALETAQEVANRERLTHEDTHDREHVLHSDKHKAEDESIKVALEAVARERTIHADAHEREHASHNKVHDLGQVAVGKAETSVEERLKAMNEFRGQLRDQQATLASRDALEVLRTEVDRRFTEMNAAMLTHFGSAEKLTQDRYESNRASIIALEKGDVKAEGKGIGQGTVIAAIVTAISVIGALLGILIIVANFATKT